MHVHARPVIAEVRSMQLSAELADDASALVEGARVGLAAHAWCESIKCTRPPAVGGDRDKFQALEQWLLEGGAKARSARFV